MKFPSPADVARRTQRTREIDTGRFGAPVVNTVATNARIVVRTGESSRQARLLRKAARSQR